MGGKGGNVKMDVNANVDSNNTFDIVGLDNIKLTTELLVPDPIVTQGRNEFAITQPVQLEGDLNAALDIKPITLNNNSDVGLDIKPVTLDLCVKLDFGGPPPMCIRQPYSHHFGITLFGVELLGFNFSGESQIIIDELPKRPQIAWGGEEKGTRTPTGHSSRVAGSDSGLRVRID
jgi:hypothetical protein